MVVMAECMYLLRVRVNIQTVRRYVQKEYTLNTTTTVNNLGLRCIELFIIMMMT